MNRDSINNNNKRDSRNKIKMTNRDSINNNNKRDSKKIKTKIDSTKMTNRDLIKMTNRDSINNNNKRSTKKEPEDQEDIIDFSKYQPYLYLSYFN